MHASRRHALLVAVNLGSFVATLDISIVNVALPAMQAALRTDMAGLQWVVDAYALCLSAFILSAGPLGTAMGRKRSWLAGVLLFVAGSAMCGLAGGLPMLLAGAPCRAWRRAVDTGRTVAADAGLPGSARTAQAIGIWASSNATALIAGPVLGGVLVAHFSWQSIFLINLPLGALAVALGMWSIRESAHPEHAAFDPLGQALSVVWLGAGLRPDRRGRAWLGLASGRPRADAGGGRPGGLRGRGTARGGRCCRWACSATAATR